MNRLHSLADKLPILRTLWVCTKASRSQARSELYWTVGFALLAVPIVLIIVALTRPMTEMPQQVLEVIGRGELMIYAAAICGTGLYSIRHGIDAPLPDSIRNRVTPLGTLTVSTSILLFVAVIFYVVRRMGDINHIDINYELLNIVSVIVLFASLILVYVILSLKFALNSGAATAAHEQLVDFSAQWEAERES